MNLSLEYLIRKPKIELDSPPLLILLHGYGSNEQDLFSFSEELPDELLIISARAPHSMGFDSYAWYTIHFDAIDGKFSDIPEAIKSRDLIAKFIDEICSYYQIDQNMIYLLGFSQGCILSYALALTYPEKVNYIIALSGYINKELIQLSHEQQALEKLDFYISHGSVDQVLPVDWGRQAPAFLDSLKIKNCYEEYPVGHGVAPQNFYSFKKWIEKRL